MRAKTHIIFRISNASRKLIYWEAIPNYVIMFRRHVAIFHNHFVIPARLSWACVRFFTCKWYSICYWGISTSDLAVLTRHIQIGLHEMITDDTSPGLTNETIQMRFRAFWSYAISFSMFMGLFISKRNFISPRDQENFPIYSITITKFHRLIYILVNRSFGRTIEKK